MKKDKLNKIRVVPLDECWESVESFKSWLVSNLNYLEETLNTDLSLIDTKQKFDGFIVDIVAEKSNKKNKKILLINCSFENFNREKLKKAFTFLGNHEIYDLLCIANRFSEKILSDVNYFNKNHVNTTFYAVALELYKIKETHSFAPLLRLLSKKYPLQEKVEQKTIRDLETFIWR
ncbi:hypothetical protein KGY71_02010 [Candidatus Bipolaricaulota bacterium]|nr:hypothetical protein [Candidatus Bipolaricaulota bacterium]